MLVGCSTLRIARKGNGFDLCKRLSLIVVGVGLKRVFFFFSINIDMYGKEREKEYVAPLCTMEAARCKCGCCGAGNSISNRQLIRG